MSYLDSATYQPPGAPPTHTTPNTAFKRKPIPVAVVAPTPAAAPPSSQPPRDRNAHNGDSTCPSCGAPRDANANADAFSLKDAQSRITELEHEVKILTNKATTAADKIADYEEELQKLRASRTVTPPPTAARSLSPTPTSSPLPAAPPVPPDPAAAAPRPAMGGLGRTLTTTRITNFLAARRLSPAPEMPTPPPAGSDGGPPDLSAQLAAAEAQRRVAEEKLAKQNAELEELSASLFSSANEMVAAERRANAQREARALERENAARLAEEARDARERDKERARRAKEVALEEKVRRLEGRVETLESRDREKAKRLERLEGAMKRVGRVRGMLDG